MSFFISRAQNGLNSLKSMVSKLWSYVPSIRGNRQQEEVEETINKVEQVIDEVKKDVKQAKGETWKHEMGIAKEKKLRSRLLPDAIRQQLIDRKAAGTRSKHELNMINKKLRDDRAERKRQADQLKKNPSRRKKINEKYGDTFSFLNENISVKKSKKDSLKNGIITTYIITSKLSKVKTVSWFLDEGKSEAVKLMEMNTGTKLVMTLAYVLVRVRLLGNEEEEKKKGFTSSKSKQVLVGTDKEELYDEGKAEILTSFGQEEHKGSGWTLKRYCTSS